MLLYMACVEVLYEVLQGMDGGICLLSRQHLNRWRIRDIEVDRGKAMLRTSTETRVQGVTGLSAFFGVVA